MDRVSTVTLIAQTKTKDAIGQEICTETGRTVYCTVLSVTRAEWSAARQQSLSPQACLRVFSYDYRRETLADFEGERYNIYRTFGIGDYIELYLEKKAGELNNGDP